MDEITLRYLKVIEEIANIVSGGHFTIMKFTTNWRGSFDTPNSFDDIQGMFVAKTSEELMWKMWQDGIKRMDEMKKKTDNKVVRVY